MKGDNVQSRLEPTSLPHNQSNDNREKASNLSDKELQERMENRSRIGFEEKDFIEQQRMLNEHRKEMQLRASNRIKSEINFSQGIRSGLLHKSIEQLRNDKDIEDQKVRDITNEKSKKYYDDNQSPKNEFKEISTLTPGRLAFIKSKDKGISRDR